MRDSLSYTYEGNTVLFEDGTRLSRVRGGSDPSQGAPAAPAGGQPAQGTPVSQGQQQQGQQPQGYGGLADGFLNNVQEAHRPIVEPYVRQWDAGVTRRFQDLHSQLKPYQDLGMQPDELSQAAQLYRMVDENPEQVLSLLQEALGESVEPGTEGGQQGIEPQGQNQTPGIPPELTQKLEMMEQVLQHLAQSTLDSRQQQEQQAEDQQLEEYLGLLQTEFGEFDEDYVLAKMMRGMDGEEAVQSWQNTIQQQVNGVAQRRPAPRVLNGGGPPPSENVQSLGKAPRTDIKNLVAQIMSSASQE